MVGLAQTLAIRVRNFSDSDDPKTDIARAEHWAERSPPWSWSLTTLPRRIWRKRLCSRPRGMAQAIAEAETAINDDPNNA